MIKGRRMSNSEVKELNAIGLTGFSKKDVVESVEFEGISILIINGVVEFFKSGDRWVPTLRRIYAGANTEMKSISVDPGAIKFISSGADVMRPGIVSIDDGISKGALVLIKETGHGKVLAIGEALYSSDEMKSLDKGKVVKNIHYVGDKLWNLQ